MKEVMGHKVTAVLREVGDYFAVLTEGGAACGITGTAIVSVSSASRGLVERIKAAAQETEDVDFEDIIDVLVLERIHPSL